MAANDSQHGGIHYKKFAIEVWDFIARNNIPYLEGNAIKYIARWRDKGGVQDIDKAIHYLQKLKELALEQELAALGGTPATPDSTHPKYARLPETHGARQSVMPAGHVLNNEHIPPRF